MVGPDGSALAAHSQAEGEPHPTTPEPTTTARAAEVVEGAEAILATALPDATLTAAADEPVTDFRAWTLRYVRRAAVLDGVAAAVAVLVPLLFSDTLSGDFWRAVAIIAAGALSWPLTVGLARGYERHHVGTGSEELRPVLRAAGSLIIIGAFPAGLFGESALLTLVVIAVPLAVLLSLTVRFVTRKWLHHVQRRGRNVRRVVVVGSAGSVGTLTQRLTDESHGGLQVIGVCVPNPDAAGLADLGVPVLGDLDYVTVAAREFGCDAVAVTCDEVTRPSYLRSIAWSLEGAGVELLVDPGLVEVAGPRMHIRPMLGFPLVHVEQPRFTGITRVAKRVTDVVLTLVGLVLISPVLFVIAAAIKITDGGPVLFRQVRVGRDGQPFTMLKFRSMVVDADALKINLLTRNEGHGALFKLSDDPRITRIGKVLRGYSLDELPQLFNVLGGSMSLVGPRPHLASEIAQMPQEAHRRSLVTPGLTGLWQVSGRSDLNASQSMRLDLRYVENWSLTLDLLILWKTVFTVATKQGAR